MIDFMTLELYYNQGTSVCSMLVFILTVLAICNGNNVVLEAESINCNSMMFGWMQILFFIKFERSDILERQWMIQFRSLSNIASIFQQKSHP